MPYTFYDGSIVVIQNLLKTLSHVLHQAEQRPDADSLLTARLREDMYPLTDQIRIVTQYSENLVARLTAREPVNYEGSPLRFAEFYERIEAVLKVANEADKDVVNGQAEVLSPTYVGPQAQIDMSGAAYAHNVVLPNVYFHVATAYGILRKEGVPLGKRDYFVGFFGPPA
ncbi:uncharacterized protein N7483_011630 [Penicillium malachiteum]|uniref:uncharacterized protein n=1 Tax=Penicillium malachiteum TaxID=1324776 RepID=UPI0025475C0D|nr:uncharacterized protein N7483_011630 [Penicillium malachiteum]KAJ5714449.1 hypothetical protein N7483_011630 [Penicillium malachiteum]